MIFCRIFLKKRNIQAVKIVGGAEEKGKGMIQHDYSIEYEGTWHSAGSLISNLENGPFVCGIKSFHAMPKSFSSNVLLIDITVSFFRLAQ